MPGGVTKHRGEVSAIPADKQAAICFGRAPGRPGAIEGCARDFPGRRIATVRNSYPAMQNFAKTFMNTLRQAETSRDPEPLVALFEERSELLTVALTEPMAGTEGARKFWTHYLATFEKIRSEFHHVIEAESEAVLEWIGEGVLASSGQAISYRGVSVLEHDGEHVQRFRSYYDSAVFVPGGAKHKEGV
jgi:hypothetical protein